MTKMVGILNITPDSFSDGGKWRDPEALYAEVGSWLEAGIDMIDVGAESTRPGAEPLSAEDEWERLQELLPSLIRQVQGKALVSLDTRHAATAHKALEAGVNCINDVSGFVCPRMIEAVAARHCQVVVMHSLSIPANTQEVLPEENDVMEALNLFFTTRIAALKAAGIVAERLIIDPGIGFGKTASQSWEILRRIDALRIHNVPLYIGHSRKSFLKEVADVPADARDVITLGASGWLMQRNVEYLRVHNVESHIQLRTVINRLMY